jgi:hypothetical protein
MWALRQAYRRHSWRLAAVVLAWVGVVAWWQYPTYLHSPREDPRSPVIGLVGGAPLLLLIWYVARLTYRGRWMKLIRLLLLILAVTVIGGGIWLRIDSVRMDVSERYVWTGWYTGFLFGTYAAAVVLLAWTIGWCLSRGVGWLRRIIRPHRRKRLTAI